MNNPSSDNQLYTKINKLIDSSRYFESFLLLKKNLQDFPDLAKIQNKLKERESAYQYMLDYVLAGNEDPSRRDFLNQLKMDLYRANDLLLRELKLKDSSDIYSSARRMFKLKNTSINSLLKELKDSLEEDNKELENISINKISAVQSKNLSDLFNYIWTSGYLDGEESEILINSFQDQSFPEYVKTLIISSIVLGNIAYFNEGTFEILLDLYENTDSLNIRARAITGLVLISLLYPTRIEGNLNLQSRLRILSEDPEFKNYVKIVIVNIIKTYDTKRIDSKMRNEVIPGLMKINPEIIDKMRNMASDSENFLSDSNPQWEDILENSDLGEKIQEINDMQLEGADVMVTAFSNLKSFPFFNLVSNWFLQFSPGYYELSSLSLDLDEETSSRLSSVMCDSDLHSFLLSLNTMMENQRNMVFSNMKRQMNEAYEAMSNSIGENDEIRMSKKIRHSLQDIYRFFKFFRKKEEFNDPFGSPFLSSSLNPLIPIFGLNSEIIKVIAEFYFKNKYFNEAVGFFELADKIEPGNFNIWEKIGYCYEKLKQPNKAVEWYRKAELVNPGNHWLDKKLAINLKNSGKLSEAIDYYNKVLFVEPENYHLLMSAGQCLLSMGEYKDALNHFYHAQYLKPEKKDALRAVAWTELLAKEYQKSGSHYESLISDTGKGDKSDFLNAAHGALAIGDYKKALALYKNYIKNSDNKNITDLVIAFRDDAEILKQLGIKTSDLRLIVDKIRYDLIS